MTPQIGGFNNPSSLFTGGIFHLRQQIKFSPRAPACEEVGTLFFLNLRDLTTCADLQCFGKLLWNFSSPNNKKLDPPAFLLFIYSFSFFSFYRSPMLCMHAQCLLFMRTSVCIWRVSIGVRVCISHHGVYQKPAH